MSKYWLAGSRDRLGSACPKTELWSMQMASVPSEGALRKAIHSPTTTTSAGVRAERFHRRRAGYGEALGAGAKSSQKRLCAGPYRGADVDVGTRAGLLMVLQKKIYEKI